MLLASLVLCVKVMVAVMMSPGSAFIYVEVDDTVRLDTPDKHKQSLLHFAFKMIGYYSHLPIIRARLLMYNSCAQRHS